MHEDPYGTIEMFPAPEPVARERRKAMRSIAWSPCPKCTAKRVGVVRLNDHLVWRHHWFVTWSGAALPCPATGIALCQLPAPADHPLRPSVIPTCKHKEAA